MLAVIRISLGAPTLLLKIQSSDLQGCYFDGKTFSPWQMTTGTRVDILALMPSDAWVLLDIAGPGNIPGLSLSRFLSCAPFSVIAASHNSLTSELLKDIMVLTLWFMKPANIAELAMMCAHVSILMFTYALIIGATSSNPCLLRLKLKSLHGVFTRSPDWCLPISTAGLITKTSSSCI